MEAGDVKRKGEIQEIAADLSQVAELAAIPGRADEFLGRALDALAEVIPFDLAAFLELSGESLGVRIARGRLAGESLPGHPIPLREHPSLARVLETRRARLVNASRQGRGEPAPFKGLVDFPQEHSSLVVPVFAGEHDVGIMTFDCVESGRYGPDTVEVATLYGRLIGLGMGAVKQADRLRDYQEILEEQNRILVQEVAAETDACEAMEKLVSRGMRRLTQMAKQVAITDAPVLIRGETGTGKEVLARAIHGWSRRSARPFIHLNCAALPENLIESELFGHRKGSFSGALSDRRGRFRLADGGTLLLDEIGDLPPAVQVKLLRVLQEGAFEPVGGDETVTVDVRILAATNADLEAAMENGLFREDLYYRLQVFPLEVPPLRERPDDLPALTGHILERARRKSGRGPWSVRESDLKRMGRHDWPGNVRELVNALERAMVFAPFGGELKVDPGSARRGRPPAGGARWPTLREHEREYVERVLERTAGKVYGPGGAAAILGLPPTTLQSRMTRLGIRRGRFRE